MVLGELPELKELRGCDQEGLAEEYQVNRQLKLGFRALIVTK